MANTTFLNVLYHEKSVRTYVMLLIRALKGAEKRKVAKTFLFWRRCTSCITLFIVFGGTVYLASKNRKYVCIRQKLLTRVPAQAPACTLCSVNVKIAPGRELFCVSPGYNNYLNRTANANQQSAHKQPKMKAKQCIQVPKIRKGCTYREGSTGAKAPLGFTVFCTRGDAWDFFLSVLVRTVHTKR